MATLAARTQSAVIRTVLSLSAICASASVLSGCRVTEDDIHRWEMKQHGPEKLEAVLHFPKYEDSLRVEAALSLIRMKPRGYTDPFDGEQNSDGIEGMAKTLGGISAEQRSNIVSALVPAIINELKKAPPVQQGDQKAPPDPSFAFKDAAYAMLTYDKTSLITDEALRASLKAALIDWAMADFETRLENRTQKYGMEQLLRFLGPDSLVGLPKLMTREARNLDKMSALIAEFGTAATKEEASKQLTAIANFTISPEWTKVKTPILQQANKEAKIQFDPDPKKAEAQFQQQLEGYQDEDLIRVLGSMKKVGGRAAIDFCLTFAADPKQKKERRQAALAALEGKLDAKAHPEDVDRLLKIVQMKAADAPPEVQDQAFRRIAELPPDKVLDKVYALLGSDQWKVRRAAGAVALKMMTVKDLDTLMSKLPEKENSKGFAMGEAIVIAANMKDLKGGSVPDALKKYMPYAQGNSPAMRTTAFSYFFSYGDKGDLEKMKPFEEDKGPAPVCETDDECRWNCTISSLNDPKQADKPSDEAPQDLFMEGVPLAGSTKEVIEAALKDMGATDIDIKAPNKDNLIEGKAKKDGKEYSITFVPAWAPPKGSDKDHPPAPPEPLKQPDIVKLSLDHAIRRAGGVILAISSKDKDTAASFISDLVKQRKDIKTVGEYVKYCVEPAIERNVKAAAAPKPAGQ